MIKPRAWVDIEAEATKTQKLLTPEALEIIKKLQGMGGFVVLAGEKK
jgi:hypothetical protein